MVIIDHQARKFTYSFLEQPGSRANSPVCESPECQVASVFYSFVLNHYHVFFLDNLKMIESHHFEWLSNVLSYE